MGFELVAVRVEEVEGVAFAAVLAPLDDARRQQARAESGQVLLADRERVMRLFGLGRHHCAGRVERWVK